MTPFALDARHFHRLQIAAAGLDYTAREPNFTLALATLTAKLKRRSLIVLFSDFADPTSAELMVESVERERSHQLGLVGEAEQRDPVAALERDIGGHQRRRDGAVDPRQPVDRLAHRLAAIEREHDLVVALGLVLAGVEA